ncbi:hypothetical protein DOCECA_04720 [Pseudomonas sp. E102]
MKYVVYAACSVKDALKIPHITNIKLQLTVGIFFTHIILLFLIPAKYTYFFDISIQESLEHRVSEGTCSPGN